MLKLMRFQDENSRLEEILRQTKKDKEIVENGHKIITAIRPHAELTMLEAIKYKKKQKHEKVISPCIHCRETFMYP